MSDCAESTTRTLPYAAAGGAVLALTVGAAAAIAGVRKVQDFAIGFFAGAIGTGCFIFHQIGRNTSPFIVYQIDYTSIGVAMLIAGAFAGFAFASRT